MKIDPNEWPALSHLLDRPPPHEPGDLVEFIAHQAGISGTAARRVIVLLVGHLDTVGRLALL